MVGGGIGVTPYASILNDLVFGTSTNRYSGVACKKVRIVTLCLTVSKRQGGMFVLWFTNVLDLFLGILLVDLPITSSF